MGFLKNFHRASQHARSIIGNQCGNGHIIYVATSLFKLELSPIRWLLRFAFPEFFPSVFLLDFLETTVIMNFYYKLFYKHCS
jgi:hypothetical protein